MMWNNLKLKVTHLIHEVVDSQRSDDIREELSRKTKAEEKLSQWLALIKIGM